ncbi:hypothetical protein ACFVH6_21310 [Spirillospora sp. NPDC127200]
MKENEREQRLRIARKAAAFEVWLANLPTAAHPHRGDPDILRRAKQILDEPEQESPCSPPTGMAD